MCLERSVRPPGRRRHGAPNFYIKTIPSVWDTVGGGGMALGQRCPPPMSNPPPGWQKYCDPTWEGWTQARLGQGGLHPFFESPPPPPKGSIGKRRGHLRQEGGGVSSAAKKNISPPDVERLRQLKKKHPNMQKSRKRPISRGGICCEAVKANRERATSKGGDKQAGPKSQKK